MKKIPVQLVAIPLILLLTFFALHFGSPYDMIWVFFGSTLLLAAIYGVGLHLFQSRRPKIRPTRLTE
jgi:hypothetical protein